MAGFKGLKEYWERKGYQRINGSDRRRRRTNKVELGSTQTRKGRFLRWKIKLSPKIRINEIPSPKKFMVWARDEYVNMMLSLAHSRVMNVSGSTSGFGAALISESICDNGFKRAPPREYDEKMIVQIYNKSILVPHGNMEVA